jgi:tripartite-type tricarboxylate transporter receptor subunit TctC
MKSYAPTIILENKPGAGQRIALEALKNSAPDGSTMMLSPAWPSPVSPHLQSAQLQAARRLHSGHYSF